MHNQDVPRYHTIATAAATASPPKHGGEKLKKHRRCAAEKRAAPAGLGGQEGRWVGSGRAVVVCWGASARSQERASNTMTCTSCHLRCVFFSRMKGDVLVRSRMAKLKSLLYLMHDCAGLSPLQVLLAATGPVADHRT